MDRFLNLVLVAGIGCFVLAFVLSGLYPWMLQEGGTPEASLDELALQVPESFRDLAARWPTAFAQTYDAAEALSVQQLLDVPAGDARRAASEAAWQRAYRKALQDGRDRYVAEGCWHCHSQYVRPVANEDVRFGPVSTWEQDNNALQRPVLWGTRRVGPDLTYEGTLRSNDWHAAHFWDPEAVTPGTVMPPYRWLFESGHQVRRRIDPALAARTSLDPQTSYPLPGVFASEAAAQAELERVRTHLPAGLEAEGERLFVAPGRGLNGQGLSLLAYIQWLGTWQPAAAGGAP